MSFSEYGNVKHQMSQNFNFENGYVWSVNYIFTKVKYCWGRYPQRIALYSPVLNINAEGKLPSYCQPDWCLGALRE